MALRTLLLALFAAAQTQALVIPAGSSALSRVGTMGATQQLCSSVCAAPTRHLDVVMAVPKKRQSKMKTRQRKANWFAKARRQAQLAMSRAKSAKYDPFEDPKYSSNSADDDDDDDDEEEDDEE